MTDFKLRRWLLVAFALVGLAVAAPLVSAHGNETTADDAPPSDGTADDWATWMDGHMTEHMGPGAVEWMESHMGVSHDEMARTPAHQNDHGGMAGNMDHRNDHAETARTPAHQDDHDEMNGQGHC